MGKNGKLGQLFVELGFKGANAIKSIDVAAGKFLLLKNAAQQMGQVFDATIKNTVGSSVQFDKLNKITGFNVDAMQKWKSVALQNNVAFETVLGTLNQLQVNAAKLRLGEGNIAPYQMLGINPFQDPIKLLDELQKKLSKLDKAQQQNILGMLGISPEMLVMMTKVNDNVKQTTYLTKQEQQALLELNRQWIALGLTFDNTAQKLSAKLSPQLIRAIKFTKELVELPTAKKEEKDNTWKKISKYLFPEMSGDFSAKPLFGNKKSKPTATSHSIDINVDAPKPLYDVKPISKAPMFTDYTPGGTGLPLPPMPANLKSQAGNTVHLTQNIHSTAEAKTVAGYSVDGIKQAFGDYELLNKDVV